MSHDHGGSFASAAGRHKRPLVIAFALTATYMVVELVGGFLFGSLALLSDAGHMLTDVVGIGMALAAIQLASRKRRPGHTYGLYRLEVLAALANALLLFAVAGYVLFEAYRRLADPPDVPGLPLLFVASVGLAVNIVSFLVLRAGAKESLNVRGAFLEVLSDMLGSLGVIVAGIVLLTTGWQYADPLIGAAIGLFILPRTWSLGREALRILLELAPKSVDVAEVERRLAAVPGVAAVHDLHVWTLTPGMLAASGHLTIDDASRLGPILTEARTLLENDYEIHHTTLQCEPAGFVEPAKEV
ncbi:MAG: cation diffusion facilitator family transporter [Gaiellaceae bacterium]